MTRLTGAESVLLTGDNVATARQVTAHVGIAGLVAWDLFGTLPLRLGVAGHEGSTVIVGLNGLRLLRDAAWRRAHTERR